uniref:Uncharacterized protein n=1 Tax=Rhizophora mucronata TaxID=61149 RepID=A0A2P2IM71_RHIMU
MPTKLSPLSEKSRLLVLFSRAPSMLNYPFPPHQNPGLMKKTVSHQQGCQCRLLGSSSTKFVREMTTWHIQRGIQLITLRYPIIKLPEKD